MNVSQLSEKKSNFKSCLLKGNHVACFSLLRRYQGMVNNIPILNAVREALLKVAVHSGFAACYQAHFKEQCIEQESNLNHFIYNLCLFMVEKDNESIFVPQYADCYVCLVRPINFLFSDNMLFCNNEIMKRDRKSVV